MKGSRKIARRRLLLSFGLALFVVGNAAAFGQQTTLNWDKVTDAAGWQPRDSQGEVVYKDRLWIFGGWFNSYEAPPRDVWSSPDGKNWNRVTASAPWKHSDLPMTVVYDDKMWLMGGWYNGRLAGHEASHEVWSSVDGSKWTAATRIAEWSPRLAAGVLAFKGQMWILGGTESYYFGDQKSLKNDVWATSDGAHWKLVTEHAGWSPRAYHAAVVHDGKMWVMGGGNYVPQYRALNDVWCSEDGVKWTRVLEAAAWPPRLWFSAAVYRDRIWVLGGWSNNPSQDLGDVWYSQDGKRWTQLKSDRIWKARHEQSTFVFQDKLWVAGGHARPLASDVWSLSIPPRWFDSR
jgi:hypothetical protein